jgi:Rrf2 family protein
METFMRLSNATQYAILAIAQLGLDGKATPCSFIAKHGNIPERFLLQVMRKLVLAGLVKSTRGVEGGYHLAKPKDQISLANVVNAVEGTMSAETPMALSYLASTSRKRVHNALDMAVQDTAHHLGLVKMSAIGL